MRQLLVSVVALGIFSAVVGCGLLGHGDCDCCGCDSCGCGAADIGPGPVPPPLAPPLMKSNRPASPSGTKDMPKMSETTETSDDLGFPQRLTPDADGLELR
jgi:hypothetical protein